jgi:type I restriction enzyme, S subunit
VSSVLYPAHWTNQKLKYVASLRSGEGITSDDISETGEYPVYGGNGVRGYTSSYNHDGTYPLIGRQGALCGNINYASGRFWASEHAVVVKVHGGHVVRWLGEVLRSMNLNQYSQSAAQPGISVEVIENLPIPVPPEPEQEAIANYLDLETARIDGLIAEKERMLTLLEEKRAALISRVVTRGLDPSVPLKPSDQEWLGEIPAHWRLERLKFHLLNIEQGWSPQCDSYPAEPDEWGVLKVGAVNAWAFNPLENKRLPDDVEPLCEYEIKPRDVLMSRANTAQLLGSVVYVNEISSKLLLCDKIYRLNVKDDEIDREFLVAFLRARPGRYQLEREASGTSGSMQNIGQDTVQNAWVAIPPLNEQREISRHLADSRAETEAMDRALCKSIKLLRERRAALITAAVTGQIPLEAMTV